MSVLFVFKKYLPHPPNKRLISNLVQILLQECIFTKLLSALLLISTEAAALWCWELMEKMINAGGKNGQTVVYPILLEIFHNK